MKFLILDTETSSLNPKKGAIIQLTAQAVTTDSNEVLRYADPLNLYVAPFADADLNPDALKVAGNPDFNSGKYISQAEAFKEFTKYMKNYVDPFNKKDKFHFVGFNVKFDTDFIRNMFARQNDKYFGSWFWNNSIDLMDLWSFELAEGRAELENFKLSTVAKFLGIKVDDSRLHDSLYDVEITRQLFRMYCDKRGII